MTYELPKNLKSAINEDWMEACVASVLERGNDIGKEVAIDVCKRQLISKKGNTTRANVGVINEILEINSEKRRGK